MQWFRFVFIILASSASLAFAGEAPASPELTLRIHYQVECDPRDEESLPGITGEFYLPNRTVRFQLFRYTEETELSLGIQDHLKTEDLDFKFIPSENCTLKKFIPEIVIENESRFIQKLAHDHSPFLNIRPDEYRRPDRDVSLGITYSILPKEGGFAIRYTYFFSNETTHGPLTTSKPTSLGAYGRRTDIEWLYEVSFTNEGEVLSKRYQGGVILGAGHTTYNFHGRYLEGTDHPVLYNIAKHNVFSDRPFPGIQYFKKTGYHLIPREEIATPEARENWMWRHPWTFDVSDRELKRDGELSHPSNEYLYIRIEGALNGGTVKVMARVQGDDTPIVAGEGKGTLRKLGEDLFSKETYSAIHLGQDFELKRGEIRLKRNGKNVVLKSPRFYHLIPDQKSGFQAEEITSHFKCNTNYSCSF